MQLQILVGYLIRITRLAGIASRRKGRLPRDVFRGKVAPYGALFFAMRIWSQLTVTAVAALMAGLAPGQTQDRVPQFDVISVKPRAENRPAVSPTCRGGRFVEGGLPILYLMRWAYQLSATRIRGLPTWASERDGAYDIEATSSAAMSDAQCRAMFQSLLASRFKMAAHRERKEMRVYALTLSRRGPKMRAVASGGSGGVIINGELFRAAAEAEPPNGLSMERLATFLSNVPAIGLPVVDRTGLAGTYTFSLMFTLRDDDDRPPIWDALQDQLGLRLEQTKALIEVLVVDHIERPSPN